MLTWLKWFIWRTTCPWCGGAQGDPQDIELLDMGVGPAGPCPHVFHAHCRRR